MSLVASRGRQKHRFWSFIREYTGFGHLAQSNKLLFPFTDTFCFKGWSDLVCLLFELSAADRPTTRDTSIPTLSIVSVGCVSPGTAEGWEHADDASTAVEVSTSGSDSIRRRYPDSSRPSHPQFGWGLSGTAFVQYVVCQLVRYEFGISLDARRFLKVFVVADGTLWWPN